MEPAENYGYRPKAKRRSKDRKRKELFEKQGGKCCLCAGPMTLDYGNGSNPGKRFATFEHIVPKSHGGKGGRNLALSCQRCNTRRGTRDLTMHEIFRAVP